MLWGLRLAWKLTLHGFAEIIASTFLLDDQPIDFPRGYVIITMQGYVKEALVITQIQINLSSVIQYIDFTW